MNGNDVKVCETGWDGRLKLNTQNIRERLELIYSGSDPEPLNCPPEPLNQLDNNAYSDLVNGSELRFTPLNLTKEQALALIQNLNHELNQTQIIEQLWQVKKGGSEGWKKAHAEFKELTKE